MPFDLGKHPGATWRKTDLQIHTPRDAGWQGSAPLPGGTAEAEAARHTWADSFVQQCLARDLGAIAITDHHDLVMYPYVESAIQRANVADRLWLFPGMEVTCNDAVQCLILFDQGTSPEDVRRLFGVMPGVAAPSADQPQAPQTEICGIEISEFLGRVYEDAVLRGKSIVLPHASKGGHKDILRRGFHPRFADLEVDGVYNEKAYLALDAVTLKKIYGELKEWGDRRRGIITTGDNRSAAYERLAVHPCWIRLGEPTAESIRQAVLADEARIAYAQPEVPSHRVVELRVSSSLTSPDFDLTLNDGFNALIGGRGSGKSALLEYLRFGLGRSTLDGAEDVTQARERGLIETTLAGGKVQVVLERDGVRETWTRTVERPSAISVDVDGQPTIELTIPSAQERFRARAFYQKQLSTLVRRRETADEQITGIAAAELVDRRRQSERDIDDAERSVSVAFQRVVQGWAAAAAHQRAKNAADDLRRRAEAIRQKLESEGLSQEQQKILDAAPVFARTDNQFSSTQREIEDQREAVQKLEALRTDGWSDALDVEEVKRAVAAVEAANAQLATTKHELATALDAVAEANRSHHQSFQRRYDQHKRTLAEAHQAQAHLSALVVDFRRLTAELEAAERNEREAQDALRRYEGTETELAKAREHLRKQLAALRGILNEAADRVEVMSNGVLRARVEDETHPTRYLEAISDLCEKCAIRELEQKCASLASETVREDSVAWEQLVGRLVAIRRDQVQAGDASETNAEGATALASALGWDLTDNQSKLLLARLDDSRLARFLSAWASPLIRFEYKDRGSHMPFERASPGQQAAALLTLLLNQEAGTLIIDQPEDDLDNKVIMTIVKLLQTTKRKRQLIFATHNPNFVVNGDADKVVALAPSVEPNAPEAAPAAQIQIEADGAIETAMVRSAITETMEGGREAFELRGRKYAFSVEPAGTAAA